MKVGQVWKNNHPLLGECEVLYATEDEAQLRSIKTSVVAKLQGPGYWRSWDLVCESVPTPGQVWSHASRASIVITKFGAQGIEGIDLAGNKYTSRMTQGLNAWINHFGWSLAEEAVPVSADQVWQLRTQPDELFVVLGVDKTHIRCLSNNVTGRMPTGKAEFLRTFKYVAAALPNVGEVWQYTGSAAQNCTVSAVSGNKVATKSVQGVPSFFDHLSVFYTNHRKLTGLEATAAEIGTAMHEAFEAYGKSIKDLVDNFDLTPPRRFSPLPMKDDKFVSKKSGKVFVFEEENKGVLFFRQEENQLTGVGFKPKAYGEHLRPLPEAGETWSKGGMSVTVNKVEDGRVYHSHGNISLKRFVNEYARNSFKHWLRDTTPYSATQLGEFNRGTELDQAQKWFKELSDLRKCKRSEVAARTKSRIAYAEERLAELLRDKRVRMFIPATPQNLPKAKHEFGTSSVVRLPSFLQPETYQEEGLKTLCPKHMRHLRVYGGEDLRNFSKGSKEHQLQKWKGEVAVLQSKLAVARERIRDLSN